MIEEEIGKGEREGGERERERPDAGESWFDGEEAEDEEWETNNLKDNCGYYYCNYDW